MNTAQYAKLQLEQALGLLHTCTDGVTDEQYNFKPAGTANPMAKSHVHALTSLDFFIGIVLKGGQMAWPAVAAANGLPANPMEMWGHAGAIPQAPVREYAKQIKEMALNYVSSLSDADFDREIETQFFGKQTVAFVVQLAGMHAAGHAGDVAAVKGLQGMKGLPF